MNPLRVYDITIPAENLNADQIKEVFKPIAKKWGFQLERGESTGYQHYQCRISLNKPKRLGKVVKRFREQLGDCYITPTSSANQSGEEFYTYTTKDTTRVSGPWTDKDQPIYVPRQVRELERLRGWQQSIVDGLGEWEPRIINVLVDRRGGIGKSVLVGYCRAHDLARKLPYCNDFKDILRMVCDMPTARAYLINMPRAIKKDKLFQLYAAIEEIKNGYAYDDRYHFKEKHFDSPNIWVFTNTTPDLTLCSRDRWRVWEVKGENLQALAL